MASGTIKKERVAWPAIQPSDTTWIDAYGGKISAEIDLTAKYPEMKRLVSALPSATNALATYPYMVLVTGPTKIRLWALNNTFVSIQLYIVYND